ncbi:MAG: carboxylating nicotinate-nucleotide diphosphorylase [Gammaproteobacteria bacterium]|nr:MAG: carboxylating nicotinate-nucleotide diphosphorylase [Gammaproteobacteria bacterium]
MVTDSLRQDIKNIVEIALIEDVGAGDLTASLVPKSLAKAAVICREPAVIAGIEWFDEVFRQLDAKVEINWHVSDGDSVTADTLLCELSGNAQVLLTGERAALNFLQSLCGVATITSNYVSILAGTNTNILDTRKTIPGLRTAQKYAVKCGGGMNHRMGLFDAILIKENHIMAAGSIGNAVANARELYPEVPIEVEVESLDELMQVMETQANSVLLDNFTLDDLRVAVELCKGKLKTEASGGIEEDTIRQIAECGVDYISVGALTKNVRALDLSMRFEIE